jgi:hypothetical protein
MAPSHPGIAGISFSKTERTKLQILQQADKYW